MQAPPPWRLFVSQLARGGNAVTLVRLAELSHAYQSMLLELSAVPEAQWAQELALVSLWRSFLAMLPASIFEDPLAPCRQVVQDRLSHILGEEPNEDDLDAVMRVVKRIQLFQLGGRRALRASSLDLSLQTHLGILQAQARRCAACGYRFREIDLQGDSLETDPPPDPRTNDDRSPKLLARFACLDHIMPVYLGGDEETNWQILCSTCNQGKSDSVLPFGNAEWFGSARFDAMTRVGPRLFYMVISRDKGCLLCGRGPRQVELRIARRDRNGPDSYTNLKVVCRNLLLRGHCDTGSERPTTNS